MTYNPEVNSPSNMEELEICVEHFFELEQTKYASEIENARQDAITNYSELPETDRPPLDDYIAMATSLIDRPRTKDDLRQQYSIFIDQESSPDTKFIDFYNCDIKLGDRYWNVALAKFISSPIDHNKVIILSGQPTIQNLRESIKVYGEQDQRIQLGPEIMSTDELFVILRKERDKRLVKYDEKIMQLDRLIRENPDDLVLVAKRQEWDNYANELCNLPNLEDAPWDGGLELTPWPCKPE